MRPAPGKTALIVNDHVGNCITHGLPEMEPVWSLDGIEKRPGEAPVWECPECGCLNPISSPVCAECGYERPAPKRHERETVAGDLVELTPERAAELRRMSRSEIEAGEFTEAELAVYAHARGYRDGWVFHRVMAQIRRCADPAAALHAYARAHGYHSGWVGHRLRELFPEFAND
jgi:ribosomal protein L40E